MAINSLEKVKDLFADHTYCGRPWETTVVYPDATEIELGGEKVKNDFYTDFPAVQKFYQGQKSEKWLQNVKGEDAKLLKEAKFIWAHTQKTSHQIIITRCEHGNECPDCKRWRRRKPSRVHLHKKLDLPTQRQHGTRFFVAEDDPRFPGKYKTYLQQEEELRLGVLTKAVPDNEFGDDIMRCKERNCNTVFRAAAEGRRHYLLIHGLSGTGCPIPYPCAVCGESFETSYRLAEHKRKAGHRKCDVEAGGDEDDADQGGGDEEEAVSGGRGQGRRGQKLVGRARGTRGRRGQRRGRRGSRQPGGAGRHAGGGEGEMEAEELVGRGRGTRGQRRRGRGSRQPVGGGRQDGGRGAEVEDGHAEDEGDVQQPVAGPSRKTPFSAVPPPQINFYDSTDEE